jgi:predicted Zn finger-like uncharacterized protein
MDIACPTCAAVYEIDDATVSIDGRKVRCAACSTVWRVFLADPVPDTLDASDAASATETGAIDWIPEAGLTEATDKIVIEEASAPAPPPRAKWSKDKGSRSPVLQKSRAPMATLAAIAAMLILVGVGIHQRATVVQYVPQTARLFAMLRLPVNLRGIEIKGVASRILDDNGVSVLVVDGDLMNVTSRKVDVPRLRFAVLSAAGQEVYVWSAQADRASIQPGETLNFRRRLAAPPGDAKDVSVRFVTKADITAGIK